MEEKIWFISDTHFFHWKPDKTFLIDARHFNTIEEMNETIINNWNSMISPNDTVYHLGDVMLQDTDRGIEILKQLNGKIHIIRGNHDTDSRIERYKECENVVEITWGTMIKYHKVHIFLSHAPSIYRTMDDKPNKQGILNFHGHTHQSTNFRDENNPYVYHVGVDSHNMKPVFIDDILEEINRKKVELLNKRGEQL